mgnify:CR=1 FL=1
MLRQYELVERVLSYEPEADDMDVAAIEEELEPQAPVKRQRKGAGRQPLPQHLERIEHPRRPDGREAWAGIVSMIRAWVQLINERSGYSYALIEIVMNPVMEREVTRHGGQVSTSNYKKAHYLV